MYKFEKLRVYHDAMLLVKEVYTIIHTFCPDEKYGLADQLRRSSTSIVLNIAEGTGSLGDTEYRSFLRHSVKSLYETVAGLKIAEMLYKSNISKTLILCDKVGKELNAFIHKLKANS